MELFSFGDMEEQGANSGLQAGGKPVGNLYIVSIDIIGQWNGDLRVIVSITSTIIWFGFPNMGILYLLERSLIIFLTSCIS